MPRSNRTIYTPAQRQRRDSSRWTLVQGVLAALQFVIFLVSLALVLRFLLTGDGYAAATVSVVLKTLILYTIMVTGAIWEREVFGQYLFAGPFFWEDVVSMGVIALHTLYLVALLSGAFSAQQQMYVAIAAYLTYLINAGQFLWKFRLARLSAPDASQPADGAAAGATS